MKFIWMSSFILVLFVQTASAQGSASPVVRPTEFEPQMEFPRDQAANINPAKQALDAIIKEKDLQNGMNEFSRAPMELGERDPFKRPKYIDDLESDLNRNANLDTTEDERIEAIRRWPLRDYRATAIMWDIQNPKVMVSDRKGTLHLLKKNYRIGNRNGIITAIHEGEIIVTERGMPVIMSIATGTK